MTPRFDQWVGAGREAAAVESAAVIRPRGGKLYNAKCAARAIGVSEWWIAMAKRAGLKFDCGNRVYLETVREWIVAHPEFRPSDWQDKRFALGKRQTKKLAVPAV